MTIIIFRFDIFDTNNQKRRRYKMKNKNLSLILAITMLLILSNHSLFAAEKSRPKGLDLIRLATQRPEGWWQIYLDSGYDMYPYSIVETREGSFAAVGYTYQPGGAHGINQEGFLLMTDSQGKTLSRRYIPDTEHFDGVKAIDTTSDNGFITAGFFNGDLGAYDGYLAKLDANGQEQWHKEFGGIYSDYFTDVQRTADSGYAVVGKNSSVDGSFQAYMVKTDINGNEEWSKTLKLTDDPVDSADGFNGVKQTSDGGYILIGESVHSDPKDAGFIYVNAAMKLNRDGEVEWRQIFDTHIALNRIIQLNDGTFLAVGFLEDDIDTYKFDMTAVRLDTEGNIIWNKTYEIEGKNSSGTAVQQLDNGNIFLFGYSEFGYEKDFYIVQINENGERISSHTMDTGYEETLLNAQKTADGGFILCGYVSANSNFDADRVIMVKTDSQGHAPMGEFKIKQLFP